MEWQVGRRDGTFKRVIQCMDYLLSVDRVKGTMVGHSGPLQMEMGEAITTLAIRGKGRK